MSNIKMLKDVKKSKRCQQTVNLYEVEGVRWPEVEWVRWPGMGREGEVAWDERVR